MAKRKKPSPNSSKKRTLDETSFPYSDYVKSDPVLKSILDRVRTGQPFKASEFTHFMAPLVQDFEAAASDVTDSQSQVPA